jgi:hypothetical protein
VHTPPADAEEVGASCLIVDQSNGSVAEATIGFDISGPRNRATGEWQAAFG